MAVEQDIQAMSDAIGRGLSVQLAPEPETPEQLKVLLRQLRREDERISTKRLRA